MEQLVGILGILLIFGAIIVVHEFGHFIVAKRSGMTVHEFSLGFGPALFSKKYGDTLYAIRIVPVGGYVRIAGMEPGEADDPNGYDKKPFFAKFLTIFAGAFMNFVLAFLLLIVLGMAVGYPQYGKIPMVGGVMPNSPAARAGLQAGDVIVEVEGVRHPDAAHVPDLIKHGTAPISVTVERKGQQLSFSMKPKELPTAERKGLIYRMSTYPGIGISIEPSSGGWERIGPRDSVMTGVKVVAGSLVEALAQFVSVITGSIPVKYLSGPVGIMQVSYHASQGVLTSHMGVFNLLNTVIMLSIFIGFFNLLPIPALDGSHLLFLVIEAVRRKPFNKEKVALVHMVGLVVLLGLVLLITFKDIRNWITGGM